MIDDRLPKYYLVKKSIVEKLKTKSFSQVNQSLVNES